VPLYVATLFLSAFLLFLVQPLIGRYLLPWFGGGPSVWTVCMLFFQILLLAGYAYAHGVRTRLSVRGQVVVHLALLAAAMLLLPIIPSAGWKPAGGGDPTWRILVVLASSVGLPYLVLAATSPLLQAWFSVTQPARSPYRLYALSNAGSLLALVSYPVAVEPMLRLDTQAKVWSALFAAFAVLCGACAVGLWRAHRAGRLGDASAAAADGGTAPDPARPGWFEVALWLALPACGSVLLLATTHTMCSDVGVVPFLWGLPLSLYLLSFILVFQRDWIYQRLVFWPLLVAATAGYIWLLHKKVDLPIVWQITGYSASLLVCCMVCHGEPHPRHLTSYYLWMSAGGALGGVFAALAAPMLFRSYFELHVAVIACLVLAMVAFGRDEAAGRRWRPWASPLIGAAFGVVLVLAGHYLYQVARKETREAISISRNFYGVLRVTAYNTDNPERLYYSLWNGHIQHGIQFAEEPLRRQPTSYYGERSGIGLAILNRRGDGPCKVGVVGLGTGSVAAYGREGDRFRFYEINPDVERLATSRFTYLADCAARCEVVTGDARLSLEREAPQAYDVLVLDAFSGDAIPVHLLTDGAIGTYLGHLKPSGVLAVHISNRFVNLEPVVRGAAERFGLAMALIDNDEDTEEVYPTTWVLLTRDAEFLQCEPIRGATKPPDAERAAPRLWTDDFSDIVSLLKWRR
jgi:hypothetical protein